MGPGCPPAESSLPGDPAVLGVGPRLLAARPRQQRARTNSNTGSTSSLKQVYGPQEPLKQLHFRRGPASGPGHPPPDRTSPRRGKRATAGGRALPGICGGCGSGRPRRGEGGVGGTWSRRGGRRRLDFTPFLPLFSARPSGRSTSSSSGMIGPTNSGRSCRPSAEIDGRTGPRRRRDRIEVRRSTRLYPPGKNLHARQRSTCPGRRVVRVASYFRSPRFLTTSSRHGFWRRT